MAILSWLWRESCNRRPREATRRAQLHVERLETRALLAASPTIAGAASVLEGGLYSLELQAGDAVVREWEIDWGDGHTETAPGDAGVRTHTYDDGVRNFTITVRALQDVTFPVHQWATNGHYYALTEVPAGWTAAEAEAVAKGGHLASITSAQEQAFVVQTFLAAPNDRAIYWLGLSDAVSEGTYVWSNGDPVSYTNWQPPNEPNNFGGNEDYVTINWHYGNARANALLGSWNDAPVNGINGALNAPQPNRGIIEFAAAPVGPTVTATLQVQVDNAVPTLAVAAPAVTVPGSAITLSAAATDASAADQGAGFTYVIDWQSDGQVDQILSGSVASFVQAFAHSGSYTITITATDKDGGIASTTHQITVLSATQQLQGVKNEIEVLLANGVLKKAQAKSLVAKLDNASKQLDKQKVRPSVNAMKAAKNEIRALVKKGALPKTDAESLIDQLDTAIATAKLETPKKKKKG